MTSPRTEAGRALRKQIAQWVEYPAKYAEAIAAIEAEAAEPYRHVVEAAVTACETEIYEDSTSGVIGTAFAVALLALRDALDELGEAERDRAS